MSTLGAYLQAEDVLLNLPVADKGSCFTPSACTSSASVAWHPEDVSSGLMRREQAGSTGLGLGMAVPHILQRHRQHKSRQRVKTTGL